MTAAARIECLTVAVGFKMLTLISDTFVGGGTT